MIVMAENATGSGRTPALQAQDRSALEGLADDLRRVFGARLHSVAAYGLAERQAGAPLNALALVERITFDDLAACAPLAAAWRRRGLNVPLILEREEFRRTLDVFPLEYGDIIARHVVVAGSEPFDGAAVPREDTRRAIELSAKSHLIHLREGYLESQGDPETIARLIAASAAAFRVLLTHIARFGGEPDDDLPAAAERQMGVPASVVRDVLSAGAGARSSIADPTELLARYISAAERIWEFVDAWRH